MPLSSPLPIAVAMLVCLAGVAAAQEPVEKPPEGALSKGGYYGSLWCIKCHSPTAKLTPDNRKFLYLEKASQTGSSEFPIWKDLDPHSRAFDVLSGPTTREMEKALGWNEGQAKKDRSCLICHSNPDVLSVLDPTKQAELLAEGVSCELCHGPSKTWFVPHVQKSFRTDLKKWASTGFRDMAHSQGRADTCTACHVGDDDHKVTHEMYGAGHPPLPAFDLALFMTRFPRHWRELPDMPPEVQAHRKLETSPMTALRDVYAGSLYSLERTSRAFRGHNSQDGARIVAGFEVYDCYSCHHEIRATDSLRKYPNSEPGVDYYDWRLSARLPPGRLRAQLWPYDVPELIAAVNLPNDPLREVRVAFLRELGEGKINPAIPPAEWSQRARAELFGDTTDYSQGIAFDNKLADTWLKAAFTRGINEPMNFDSARIIGGAIWTVLKQRHPNLAQIPEAAKALEVLETQLSLKVDWPTRAADPAAQDGPIVIRLSDMAKARSQYSPAAIRDALKGLEHVIANPPKS